MVDGSGAPPVRADLRIDGGRIVEIGPDLSHGDSLVTDLTGKLVTPGFIDLHAHSEGPLWRDPHHLPKVAQGVTFELLGQDGLGFAPVENACDLRSLTERLAAWHGRLDENDLTWCRLSELMTALETRGLAINAGFLVPHGTLRAVASASGAEPLTDRQWHTMESLLRGGLEDGAFGLSTGLAYAPARYADTEELVRLASIVGPEGLFVPHLRDYGQHAFDSYAEGIEIATRSGVRLHLTHALLNGSGNVDRATEFLELLNDTAPDATLDVYPYDAGSTYLHVFLPGWIETLEEAEQISSLREDHTRRRIESATSHINWDRVVLAGVEDPSLQRWTGSSVGDIARAQGVGSVDAYCELLIADKFKSTCVHFNGNAHNVDTLAHSPSAAIASDSILVGAQPHPRGWGTFARFIQKYVATGDIGVGPAIRKVTGLPASILQLGDRGLLKPGMRADLVSFDPAEVRENATYSHPKLLATGFDHVFVNGESVIADGEPTGNLAGMVVRAQSGHRRA